MTSTVPSWCDASSPPHQNKNFSVLQGIVVETPEERKAKAIATIMKEKDDFEESIEIHSIGCRSDMKMKMEVDGSNGNTKQEKGYTWTQTNEELEVVVVLPDNNVTIKQWDVQFQPRSLLVMFQKQTILDLQLFEEIDIEASTWIMDKTDSTAKLTVTMEKVEQAMWSRIHD